MAALYIQAEGGGSAWQVWPGPATLPAGALREGSAYIFELRDCDDAIAADLLIDDIPADALRSRQPSTARWRWQLGFHAGTVNVLLRSPSLGTRNFEVTTDPDVRKLTRGDFDAMVREVLEDTFALFSLSAFRKGIARQPSSRLPPLARLEFLRSRLDEILNAAQAIARSPRHYLRAEEMTIPAHRAARATGPEIIKSFRSGVIRRESVSPSRLPASLRGHLPAHIRLRQRRNSMDIPEHRQIKACLHAWAAWLAGVADLLDRRNPADDPEMVTTVGMWAIRSRKIARQLQEAAQAHFLREVGEAAPVLRMSSLFRGDPLYQRFYRLWQDMNLGLAALFGDFLQMPLARTYELYELWCFLRLLRAAIEEYNVKNVDLSKLFISEPNGGVVIAAGAITVPIGGDRVLCFQRQYREYWVSDNREGSFSRTMIPDVVLAGTGLGGPNRSVIVLDAKYRINDGLNDALNSIHTYRDALVKEAATGRTEGIVTAAYLLTPHIPASLQADFRTTPMPGRLFHPQYRQKFRFGALTLKPGMTGDELRLCLRRIVSDAGAKE